LGVGNKKKAKEGLYPLAKIWNLIIPVSFLVKDDNDSGMTFH
jgi:hypothetical protein